MLCEFLSRQQLTDDSAKKAFSKACLFGREIAKPIANLAKMSMFLIGEGHTNIQAVDSVVGANDYMRHKKQFDHAEEYFNEQNL